MKLALPKFQFRFIPQMGNVIFPGNFHPVGSQRVGQSLVERAAEGAKAGNTVGEGGSWIVVGGSGGFGSASRAVLGATRGADTLNVSFDAAPRPDSKNAIRKIGSPGFHRTLGLQRALKSQGRTARSLNADAFDPVTLQAVITEIREHFGGKLKGLVWALAAPRAVDPRTGKQVASALKPCGRPARVRTFTGADARDGTESLVKDVELQPGTPQEAVRTIYVMGGGIVARWISALLDAGVLADGFTLVTISYRGNPINEAIYHKGLIGLAKADLEYETQVLDSVLQHKVSGRAVVVEGPAIVTEASGGIPGVPFYAAHMLDVMGERFEDALDSMKRMFAEHFTEAGPALDDEGLLRMDDRELAAEVQQPLAERFEQSKEGDVFDRGLYDNFMKAYAQTRGFDLPGLDYAAEFDSDEICVAK